ncbi:hypothetical protein TorRG33x02_356910, partial [Trema orientale]
AAFPNSLLPFRSVWIDLVQSGLVLSGLVWTRLWCGGRGVKREKKEIESKMLRIGGRRLSSVVAWRRPLQKLLHVGDSLSLSSLVFDFSPKASHPR